MSVRQEGAYPFFERDDKATALPSRFFYLLFAIFSAKQT